MEHNNYKTLLSVFLKSIRAGKKYHEYSLDVGMTPPVLLDVGLPRLPMTISVKIIDKVFFDHGISEALLKRLYDLIAKPQAIFKSDSPHVAKGDEVVIITVEVKNGNNILVAVHPNRIVGRRAVNQIKSVYDKPEGMLRKWRDKGLLLWDESAALAELPALKIVAATDASEVVAPIVNRKKVRLIAKN